MRSGVLGLDTGKPVALHADLMMLAVVRRDMPTSEVTLMPGDGGVVMHEGRISL